MAETKTTTQKPQTPVKPTDNGKPVKDFEAKDAKFKRLANMRVPAAVKRIGHVGNLANRLSYTYTPEQAAIVIKALRDAVAVAESRFRHHETAAVHADLFG